MVVKYWAGTITPEIIQGTSVHTWGLAWLLRAQKAEQAGNELIVLEVPKNEVTNCIATTEQSLEMFLRLDVG
jgi:hypothetical protein